MYTLMLLASCCGVYPVYSEDLCDRVQMKYTIGRATPILNIQAEEISKMHVSCYKEIVIPGAKTIQLNVNEAEFGYNKAYEYNGLTGTGYKPVYDKIEVYFGNCSTFTPRLEISTGLNVEFGSESLCLHIQPEVEYRALGAHSPGGKIQIDVKVEIAICLTTKHYEHRACQPLCSKYRMLNNCHKDSTLPSNISAVQISTQTTFNKLLFNFTTSIDHTPTLIGISKVNIPRTPDESLTTQVTPAMETISISTVQAIMTKTNANPPLLKPKATTPIDATTFIPEISSTHKEHTEYRYITWKLSPTTVGTIQQNASDLNVDHKKANFGLLEGLYVIAGSIVILLVLGIVAFLVRKRRKHDLSSGSNSGTVFRTGLHWRDNWLVRYHNNEIEGDNSSQPESELQYVHTSYLNQSNTDSQFTNHSEYPEVIKYKLNDDPYDNPWPLVRLNSEFVRNTKRIESGKEPIKIIRNLDRQQSNSENNDDSSSNYDENLHETLETEADCYNTVKRKVETTNEDEKRHKKRLQKHFSPTLSSRGKYSVQKVERSNSKKGFLKSHMKNERRKSESRSNHSENNMKRYTSKKRSSSMRSGNATTFDEMMRDEIKTIEEAMDVNGNTDTESHRSEGKHGSERRRNWKVNTLYAVVSSRNKFPSQDVLIARKPLRIPQVDDISLRESEISNSLMAEAVSKKGNNSSQKSSIMNKPKEISGHYFEYTQPSMNYDRINNTNTKAIDSGQAYQAEIREFIYSKENNDDSQGQVINQYCQHSDIGNTHSSRDIFLQNRKNFENNGSIGLNKSGASGTGQFPK